MTLSTRPAARALAANLYARDRVAQGRIRALVRRRSEMLWEDVFADCPKDTWFMADNLRYRVTEQGLAYEVGWEESDFVEAGRPFYPVYVIFGTSRQAPNDPLFPNKARHDAEFRKELRAELSAAIARGRRR